MKSIFILTLMLVTSVIYSQETITVQIKANTKPCQGVAPMECLQVKFQNSTDWELFYSAIEGFQHEKGFEYVIEINKSKKEGVIPADASAYRYQLKRIISKKLVPISQIQDTKMILTHLNGEKTDSNSVYITIDSNGTIHGKSGCNQFSIPFSVYANKTCIKTGSGMGTLMACDEKNMRLETQFLNTLQNKKIRIKHNGNTVSFKNGWGKTLMVFSIPTEKSLWSFIGQHKWKLFMIDNVSKDYNNAFIQFNTAENKVSGNSGCNNFFGSFTVKADAISFSQMASTRMACLNNEVNASEQKILQYFNQGALRYDVADQTLNFYLNNKLVMLFGLEK